VPPCGAYASARMCGYNIEMNSGTARRLHATAYRPGGLENWMVSWEASADRGV